MPRYTHAELISWSAGVPDWQRDALRRLLEHSDISAEGISELATLAMLPHSAAPPDGPKAVPASEDHKPPTTEVLPVVSLTGIDEIERVNALGKGPVTFNPKGLTVVYGDNASGKSGVVRILKKACRARDPGGPIIPNVFEAATDEPASARIDFEVNGAPRSHPWIDGGSSETHLRTINVFDTRCATVQIEKRNLVSYTPAILELFQNLADVVDLVAKELKARKAELGGRPAILDQLQLGPTTAAGKFVQSLNEASDIALLERICRLSEKDDSRIIELKRALQDDPKIAEKLAQARSKQLEEIDRLIGRIVVELPDDAHDQVRNAVAVRDAARTASELAWQGLRKHSNLDGVGSDAWRMLWEAARKYSETHAYIGEPYPVVRDGAACVLCQQTLSPEAANRLHSFDDFVKDEVQRRADEAATHVRRLVEAFESLVLPETVRDIVEKAALQETPEGEQIRDFVTRAKLRRRALVRLAEGKSVKPVALPERPDLEPTKKKIQQELTRLRAASEAEERQAMQNELADLEGRSRLAPHRDLVVAEIARLRAAREIDAALEDCKTNSITIQAGIAERAVITDLLRANFATNLSAIGFAESPVEVELAPGDRGKRPYKMKLMSRPDVSPGDVLSEGERTCVALAGFLAELETTGNLSGIVLDDPVSSLDQNYRGRVAERLAVESRSRQVVILTHDLIFLYFLRKAASDLGFKPHELSLIRGYKRDYGKAVDGPPWDAMFVNQRVGRLRKDLVAARKILTQDGWEAYEKKASDIYKHLRKSWERAIEEVLLNQTVLRFGDEIQTRRLKKIVDISEQDIEKVTTEMSRCSTFEHDSSAATHTRLPDPDIVEGDINRLAEWVDELRSKRERN